MEDRIKPLSFKPLWGFSSPHLQTILSTLLSGGGIEPPSTPLCIPLEDGDSLHCRLSTPPFWTPTEKTILLIHGLGGSHTARYMVRMSRKFYQKGWRVLRINLRGNGEGTVLAQKPYHGGSSDDVFHAIQYLKKLNPDSPLILIGYSLGGNIALKLAAELGEKEHFLLDQTIAICPPIDLSHSVHSLQKRHNHLYHQYYLKGLNKMGCRWIGNKRVRSILEFDHTVTAAQWNFKDAFDYYRKSSSCYLLSKIRHPCHLIFAEDDPFVDHREALKGSLHPTTHLWLSKFGGHMGFLGWAGKEHGWHWLDRFLLQLIQ